MESMMEQRYRELEKKLNDPEKEVRLKSLRQLMDAVHAKKINAPVLRDEVNNHIHTTYSFSPYSPAKAIWESYQAGLQSAGIMDHDSICGAYEFLEAGTCVGIATTIGIECRADFSRTPLNGRRINNPDQKSNAYIALHGIPHNHIPAFRDYFQPLISARHTRNALMTDRINHLLEPAGITINYEQHVLPLSSHRNGGTVTERHLLFALIKHLTQKYGKGERFLDFLKGSLGVQVTPAFTKLLMDSTNAFYEYDALSLLKRELVEAFYCNATDECPHIHDVLAFAKKYGCICAYAYLGDVYHAATGEIKARKFEDDYLDELILCIKELGFKAVTYMPSRNTPAQLARIMELCKQHTLLQICGEDINAPRQPFVCRSLRKTDFRHVVDVTWALIGHEKAATHDCKNAFFSAETIKKYPDLDERIAVYKEIGLKEYNLP